MRPIYLMLMISVSLFLNACGPLSAHTAIAKAHISLEAAKGAQADQYAIYEFKRAQLYLWKAREEEGFSSFQDAINFAKRSIKFAEEARSRALTRKRVRARTPIELQRERMRRNKKVPNPTAPNPAGIKAAPPVAPVPAPAPAPQPNSKF